MSEKKGYVYILTNPSNTVLYTGFTTDLKVRIKQHKDKVIKGFTLKYNINKLVYFESTDYIQSAIAREKQIKAGSRAKKIALIESMNPEWKDLYESLF